jgi:hypothetical protein
LSTAAKLSHYNYLVRAAVCTILAALVSLLCPAHTIARSLAVPNEATVEPAQRSTLLIWDKRSLTEHLVVQVPAVRDHAPSPSFTRRCLVATPTRPELTACSDDVFSQLKETYYPTPVPQFSNRVVVPYSMVWAFFDSSEPINYGARSMKPEFYDDGEGSAPPPHTLQFAVYRAAELDTHNSGQVVAWLKSHGFDSQAAIVWMKSYIAKGWMVTAVEGIPGDMQSLDLRVSFKVGAPVLPAVYPCDVGACAVDTGSKLHRVFVLSDGRMEIVPSGPDRAWPARLAWADPFPTPKRGHMPRLYLVTSNADSFVAADLQMRRDELPPKLWLTVFEDREMLPRTTDVTFRTSADQKPVDPAPYVYGDGRTYIPVDLIAILGVVAIAVFRGLIASLRKLRDSRARAD